MNIRYNTSARVQDNGVIEIIQEPSTGNEINTVYLTCLELELIFATSDPFGGDTSNLMRFHTEH